jgi:hypothetical protein
MNALHLSTTQYFALAGLFALTGVAFRGFGGTALTAMAKRLKAHLKLIGIETNSYRTRGSQYTVYEHEKMENMYNHIFNTSVQWVIFGLIGLTVSIIAECLFTLPAPPLYVLSLISAWIAAWYLFIVVSNYITTGVFMWIYDRG